MVSPSLNSHGDVLLPVSKSLGSKVTCRKHRTAKHVIGTQSAKATNAVQGRVKAPCETMCRPQRGAGGAWRAGSKDLTFEMRLRGVRVECGEREAGQGGGRGRDRETGAGRDREADVGPWSPCSGPGGWFPQQETTFLIKRWLHLLFGRTNLLDYGR